MNDLIMVIDIQLRVFSYNEVALRILEIRQIGDTGVL